MARWTDAPARIRHEISRAIVNSILTSGLLPDRLRVALFRRRGAEIGLGTRVYSRGFVGDPEKLKLGSACFVNHEVFFDLSERVTLGDRVDVGFRTSFVTSSHVIGPPHRRAATAANAPIKVGSGCWLGAHVVVLPGVTITPGTVVAAGSVVVTSLTTPGLYAGVPARLVRDLGDTSSSVLPPPLS